MQVRRERNRILRDVAAAKNLEFRRRMVGKKLSVVTLADSALSENYLKVQLARPRPANQLVDVSIGSLSDTGLREQGALPIL